MKAFPIFRVGVFTATLFIGFQGGSADTPSCIDVLLRPSLRPNLQGTTQCSMQVCKTYLSLCKYGTTWTTPLYRFDPFADPSSSGCAFGGAQAEANWSPSFQTEACFFKWNSSDQSRAIIRCDLDQVGVPDIWHPPSGFSFPPGPFGGLDEAKQWATSLGGARNLWIESLYATTSGAQYPPVEGIEWSVQEVFGGGVSPAPGSIPTDKDALQGRLESRPANDFFTWYAGSQSGEAASAEPEKKVGSVNCGFDKSGCFEICTEVDAGDQVNTVCNQLCPCWEVSVPFCL